MSLSGKQRRHLRGLAHHRKPVVTLGAAGLTDAVLEEIVTALAHHELLKIKVQTGDRAARHGMLQEICARTQADPVQEIGKTIVVYRPAAEPKIALPRD